MNSQQRMSILLFACLTTPKHKENSIFQYFYCATCWVLWCATRCTVFCSVLNVVVQFYLRARQTEFHVVTNCKYIVKYILWKYVHFQIFAFTCAFTCIYLLPFLFENQWNVDKDKRYLKMQKKPLEVFCMCS